MECSNSGSIYLFFSNWITANKQQKTNKSHKCHLQLARVFPGYQTRHTSNWLTHSFVYCYGHCNYCSPLIAHQLSWILFHQLHHSLLFSSFRFECHVHFRLAFDPATLPRWPILDMFPSWDIWPSFFLKLDLRNTIVTLIEFPCPVSTEHRNYQATPVHTLIPPTPSPSPIILPSKQVSWLHISLFSSLLIVLFWKRKFPLFKFDFILIRLADFTDWLTELLNGIFSRNWPTLILG